MSSYLRTLTLVPLAFLAMFALSDWLISGEIAQRRQALQLGPTADSLPSDMLTLLEQPSPITFSRNPVRYRFRAVDNEGDPYGPRFATASVSMNNTGLSVGNKLLVNWTEPDGSTSEVTFNAVANPEAVDEIPAQPSGLSNIAYFEAIRDKLAIHPQLAPFFQATLDISSNFTLTLSALDLGYAVSFDVELVNPAANPQTTTTLDIADNTPAYYEARLEVFVETAYKSGNYERVASLSSPPDGESYLTFDLSDVLESVFQGSMVEPRVPGFNGTSPVIADNLRHYYIRYREHFEGVLLVSWTMLDIQRVLGGGVSDELFQLDFFSTLNAENSFLSWYPDRKTVSPSQPEYLGWFNYHDESKRIMLQVQAFDEDGQNSYFIRYHVDALEVAPGETLLIPVGHQQLELDAIGMRVVKYIVRVVVWDPDQMIGSLDAFFSQHRTYYVDHDYYELERYLQYLNSFSLPETIRCTGNQEVQLNIEREETESIDGWQTQFQQDFRHRFVYRTGYLPAAAIDALQELLIYGQLYEVSRSYILALQLKDKRYGLGKDRQFLNGLTIRTEPRQRQFVYSQGMMPSPGQDFTSGGIGFWTIGVDFTVS